MVYYRVTIIIENIYVYVYVCILGRVCMWKREVMEFTLNWREG